VDEWLATSRWTTPLHGWIKLPRKRIRGVGDLPMSSEIFVPVLAVAIVIGGGIGLITNGNWLLVVPGVALLLIGVVGPLLLLAAYLQKPLADLPPPE